MTPRPVSAVAQQLVGRYPLEYQEGWIMDRVRLSELHEQWLKPQYFPILGMFPKSPRLKNKRHIDMNVACFEVSSQRTEDRSEWGLPVPNLLASYKNFAKYAKPHTALEPQVCADLNRAAEWMERHFGPYMQCSRIKTTAEVISGLDLSTSPGFPWVRKHHDKVLLVQDFEFLKWCEQDWEALKDENYRAVFSNSLKEEIRPAEKIEQNKIRTFTAGPIEMTIHGNRLFEDMNEKFYASYIQSASVVGFCPLKGGWDVLIRKLKVFKQGFECDESEYDSSLRSYLLWMVCKFRWQMLREEDRTPENHSRIQVYYLNLIHTVVITAEGVLVQKPGGNPSGSVNTITDNTLVLFILLSYAWIVNMRGTALSSYGSMMSNTRFALCGDDNTWSVSDEAVERFNVKRIIPLWTSLGITTTTPSMEARPVDELGFLSAVTVYMDGVALPLYNRSKFLTSLLYSAHGSDPIFTLVRACALYRVSYADIGLRGYFKELIQWLLETYDPVYCEDPEWIEAKCSIPSENQLRVLMFGTRFVKQSFIKCDRQSGRLDKSGQKMNALILPQRVRKQRTLKKKVKQQTQQQQPGQGPRRRRARARRGRKRGVRRGPRMASGAFYSGGGGDLSRIMRNAPRRKRVSVVEQDEYIGSVSGSVAFATTSYAINPGQSGTFPWLSLEAKQWEKYKFRSLEFYFKTTISQFATNGLGKIILSVDYDASDPPPASKQQAEDSDPHVDDAPYENLGLRLDPREMHRESDAKFVRPGILPGAADIKTYDCGTLAVSTQGNVNTDEIGELHVRYIVEFSVPVLESETTAHVNNRISWFNSSAAEAVVTATPTVALLATATTNGLTIVNTAGSMVPPAGNYIVDGWVRSNDTSAEAFDLQVEFQKDAVDTLPVNGAIRFQSAISLGASAKATVPFCAYVTANGTNAFTVSVTMTGAAGTLTIVGSCRWMAV